jgi:hypothetical protein
MQLVAHGSSNYVIVVGREALPSERYAAGELQRFLEAISGVALPIVDDGGEGHTHEILVGDSRRLRALGIDLAAADLGKEGLLVRTVGSRLVLAGGRPRGTLYAVYTFLEEHLGCRWFTPDVSRIPKRSVVALDAIDRRVVPILEWREPRCGDLEVHGDWSARNKHYGRFTHLEERHGDKLHWEHYVHTFYPLVPLAEHWDEHPEYFSEIDGQRRTYLAQLCLSNPDVLRLVIEGVRRWMEEDPASSVVSVSQNDWHGYCQCADCAALDAREGSPSGSMIHFVNQVAEAIEPDYPNLTVSTLAYQYTRHAPRTLRPRHNVVPVLCSIECCFSHPLTECERNASFVEDMRAWSEISPRLYVWDYVTEFGHYQSPWPNLYSLQPNIQFFVENGVRGVFEQGPGSTSEFAELRTYLLGKLLWDPDTDVDATIDDFLEGYYGGAAGALKDYIRLLHDKARKEHLHSHIWSPLNRGLFTPDWLQEAAALFDQAERDATGEAELKRVQVARLPLEYVKVVTHTYPEEEMRDVARQFMRVAHDAGISEIREGTPVREFSKDVGTLHTTRDRYEVSHG